MDANQIAAAAALAKKYGVFINTKITYAEQPHP
jgi:hypothetical protein